MKNKISKKKILGIGMKVATIITVLLVKNSIVFATDDPLAVINNLKNFMYQIIGAIRSNIVIMGNCTNRYGYKIT